MFDPIKFQNTHSTGQGVTRGLICTYKKENKFIYLSQLHVQLQYYYVVHMYLYV